MEEELEQGKKAIFLLGGKCVDKKIYTLPETDMGRAMLLIQKIEPAEKNILERRELRLSHLLVREILSSGKVK